MAYFFGHPVLLFCVVIRWRLWASALGWQHTSRPLFGSQ